MLTIDPFLRIEHIFRLWKEYELALQKREMAVVAETSRLERLQLAGEKIEHECSLLQTQEAALEKRINEVHCLNVGLNYILTMFSFVLLVMAALFE